MKQIVCLCLFFALFSRAEAQRDTLRYDTMTGRYDGSLLAVTRFPGELDVVLNTRFSPMERCILEGLELGFSVVKFDANSGADTLLIFVYENSTVPPLPRGVERTYVFDLGNAGIPDGNIAPTSPLSSGARELRFFPLNPPIVFAPKRDFLIGVKLRSKQRLTLGEATWDGFTVLVHRDVPAFDRYRRLSIGPSDEYTSNQLVSGPNNASMHMRAVVRYDATLPDTKLTESASAPDVLPLSLRSVFPNPLVSAGRVIYSQQEARRARLTVHDALGRERAVLADGESAAGEHAARIDAAAAGLEPGLYMLRLTAGGAATTRALIVAR